MAHRSKLIVAALAVLACGASHAYVLPSPPPGFAGTPGNWTFAPQTAAQQLNGIMRGAGPSIAGAGATNAAYRLGAGASRVLAGALFASPLLLTAGAAAWLAQKCVSYKGGSFVLTCGDGADSGKSDGFLYRIPGQSTTYRNADMACKSWIASAGAGYAWAYASVDPQDCMYTYQGGPASTWGRLEKVEDPSCPAGWYYTPGGCVQKPPPEKPLTKPEVEEIMAPQPLPAELPPRVPYPVEAPPIWNPTPDNPPVTQPLRVPQGDPVPVTPAPKPPTYKQPVTEWTHSPTQAEPWRMDVSPREITGTDPKGIKEPTPVPQGTPPAGSAAPTPDLCVLHPDILACAKWKLGELEPDRVPNKTVDLSIKKDEGWGPASATCPPPRTATVLGQQISMPFTMLCDFANGIRPLLLAFAWLSAALTFFGLSRKD